MNAAPGWTLGRTLLNSPALGGNVANQLSSLEFNTSNGWGNYNSVFASISTKDWHGLTMQSNFTWGRSLGTGSVVQATSSFTLPNPWDPGWAYGPQPFDVKFVYNLVMLYQSPFFKSQQGFLGHVLGGWAIAPIFTARTGFPLEIDVATGSNTDAQAFGEVYGNGNGSNENAIGIAPYTGGNSAVYGVAPTSGCGINSNPSRGGSGINLFSDPNAVCNEFRRPVLGIDTSQSGAGVLRTLPTWNLDATISKDIRATEHIGATLIFQFTNLLNHFQAATPALNIDSPTSWGAITGQYTYPNGAVARAMEFGLRIHF